MMDKKRRTIEKLERFYDALAADLDNLTDEELLAEARDDGKDVDQIASHVGDLISQTIEEAGRKKMVAARVGFDAQRNQNTGKLLRIPLVDKKRLIEEFTQKGLTLAARSGSDTEADIDSILEDLLALNAIDDEGNIK